MISAGILYMGLAYFGLRFQLHWAKIAFHSAAISGFLGIFLFIGYGYFDSSTLNALNAYKQSANLEPDGILDKQTYDSIISKVVLDLSNIDNDEQFQKAIEIVKKW